MRLYLQPLFILTFLGFGIHQAFSQGFTGRAYYKSSSKISISLDSTKMAPEQMAQIQSALKKQMERNYILSFTPTESIWKQEESLGGGPATASAGGAVFMVASSGEGSTLYKDAAGNYLQEQEMMGKEYLIKDKAEPFEWELSEETKKIGNYTAQKASFTKIVDSRRFSTGMTEMENVKDTLQVTVWFTPEIPVSHGPEYYFGLPGLILEVQNQGRTLICEKIELNPSADPVVIERPSKGKPMTQAEFQVVQEEGMKQMMNRYQGKPGDGTNVTIRIGN
ncbi:MAG: GLPGLI family protein [Bacteroidota bacterium]|jgi:GLPGLI family protein|nr:GLPGLI family protein [Algoriphagus sp.]